MTPPPLPPGDEGVGVDGAAVVDPTMTITTPLQAVLARGPWRATLAMLGPGVRRVDRLRRSGQLRHERAGGRRVRLPAAVGRARREPDGDADPVPVGEAGDRHRPQPARGRAASSSPRPVTWGMWVQAEIMAMSTDIAEFVGAALGLNLLFGVPLLTGGHDHRHDRVRNPRAAKPRLPPLRAGDHGSCLGSSSPASSMRPCSIGPSAHGSLHGLRAAFRRRADRSYLAVGIVGATVMPHVIYLHSALTKGRMPCRNDARARPGPAVRAPGRDLDRARARGAGQHGDARRRGATVSHARH